MKMSKAVKLFQLRLLLQKRPISLLKCLQVLLWTKVQCIIQIVLPLLREREEKGNKKRNFRVHLCDIHSNYSLLLLKEKKVEEKKEEKEEKKEGEKNDVKKEEEFPEIVLKVDMHCDACARKVARALKGFEGVQVSVDSKASKVVVKGKAADPKKVWERLQKKSGRKVDLISPLPKPPEEKNAEIKEPPKEEKKEDV